MKYVTENCLCSSSKRNKALALSLMACLSLNACSPAALPPNSTLMKSSLPPAAMNSTYGQALRVIVKFRQTVPYRDEIFLQDIAQKIHARITYISSVSLDTHVYQIKSQPGQSHADILRSLSGIPVVLHVEADALAQPF